MKSPSRMLVAAWTRLGPRSLPFADVATPDLPLSRLLRLSLFQASVGMAMVLLVGTLNRVMIVELGVPASLVAIMVSLPVVYVRVPDLTVEPVTISYTSAGPGKPIKLESPVADTAITVDNDGFILDYPGLAERI